MSRKSPNLTPEQRQALADHMRRIRFNIGSMPEPKRKQIARVGGYMRWFEVAPEQRQSEMARVRQGNAA